MRSPAIVLLATAATAAAQLSFLALGDWGGQQTAPYTTVAQTNVAAAMAATAANLGSSFVIILGDNFYDNGVASESDPRFQQTFEDVYTGASLQGPKFKWYISPGNHDHLGNVSAQVAYSSISNRWTFPSPYYSFSRSSPDGAVIQFVMIDTIVLTGSCSAAEECAGPVSQRDADEQWTWIQQTMAASTADYLVVAGHYPVWSVCENGPFANLVAQLKPLLEKYQGHYFAGHDHCEQYIDEGLGPQYHGIGAGHSCQDKTKHAGDVPAGSLKWHYDCGAGTDDNARGPLGSENYSVGAYAAVSVSKKGMQVTHYDDSGTILFTAPAVQPRSL